jgi:hypothetical protein
MKYPKIDTLFKRDTEKKNTIMVGEYSKDEFTNIKTWLFTEKVDGTNIRVNYDFTTKEITFDGKTDDAEIPARLYKVLTRMFTPAVLDSAFAPSDPEKPLPGKVTLYGEGYGPGIHGGETYRSDLSFILFDVLVDQWWLERANVEDVAKKLNISVVPIKGIGSLELGIELVKQAGQSLITPLERPIEGIVATSYPMMMFRKDGMPIKWKLKVKDYRQLALMEKTS